MSNNTTNTSSPDSLMDDIDFSQAGTSNINDSSSYFSQQIDSITTGEQDIGALLTPDESFLNSIPGGLGANTENQVITPSSRFIEEPSAFPTLIMDDNDGGFSLLENETPIEGNEINSKEIHSSNDFITGVSLKFPELKNFFIFLTNNKDVSEFLKNKLSSFFCGSTCSNPFDSKYNYEGDEGFVGRDSPTDNINRFGLILIYCMYELGIGLSYSGGPDVWVKYVAKNFITDKLYLEKFSHIVVSRNRMYFGTAQKPKIYIQLDTEVRSRIEGFFKFLFNYSKSIKAAIIKLKEDDERTKRFAEKMERIKKRQEGLNINDDLLNKIDIIAEQIGIDDV